MSSQPNVLVDIKDANGKVLGTIDAPPDATDEQIAEMWKQKQASEKKFNLAIQSKIPRDISAGFFDQFPSLMGLATIGTPTNAKEVAAYALGGGPAGLIALRGAESVGQQAQLGAADIAAGGQSKLPLGYGPFKGQVKSFGRTLAAMMGMPGLGTIFDDIDAGNVDAAAGGVLSIGLQALMARSAAALGEGTSAGLRKQFGKIPLDEAASKVADQLSKAQTAAELTTTLRETQQAIRQAAGITKQKVVADANQLSLAIPYKNTLTVLREELGKLRARKADSPTLFKEGEAQGKTLSILEELEKQIAEEAAAGSNRPGAFAKADARRSGLFAYRQELDPSNANRIIGRMDEAITKDMMESLQSSGNAAVGQEYLKASNRYRQILDASERKLWEKILEKTTNSDEVVKRLASAPAESAEGIRNIFESNPKIAGNVRRAVFEQWVRTGEIQRIIPKQTVDTLFGEQAKNINSFVSAVKAHRGLVDIADDYLRVRFGPASLGGPIEGNRIIQVRIKDIAKAIDDPSVVQAMVDAGRTPMRGANANIAAGTLVSVLQNAGIPMRDIRTGTIDLSVKENRPKLNLGTR